ncbi:MAG: hypothetical protein U1E15_14020 [Hyphomicrobiales bacterium]
MRLPWSLAVDNTILISAVCYRKALHDRLGRFDAALPYYWDWDWYIRVARSGAHLQHIPEVITDIRIHGQNMSGDATRAARQANLDAFAGKLRVGAAGAEKPHGFRLTDSPAST